MPIICKPLPRKAGRVPTSIWNNALIDGVELVGTLALARLPFLPAPGSTSNLIFSTLICNASLAELNMSSLISSHLLYQTMCNVSEKVGLTSQRANGHKNCALDTYSLDFLPPLCCI
jgi:hypothetical protein